LLIDDNLSVLNHAQRFGMRHLFAVNKPDLQKTVNGITTHQSIEYFDGLYSMKS